MAHIATPGVQRARSPSAQRAKCAQQPGVAQPHVPGSSNTEWQSLRASQAASVVTPAQAGAPPPPPAPDSASLSARAALAAGATPSARAAHPALKAVVGANTPGSRGTEAPARPGRPRSRRANPLPGHAVGAPRDVAAPVGIAFAAIEYRRRASAPAATRSTSSARAAATADASRAARSAATTARARRAERSHTRWELLCQRDRPIAPKRTSAI